MIDLDKENLLTLHRAAEWWERKTKRRKTRSTIWRWIKAGVKRSDGTFVRLEAMVVGRCMVTSKEALQRFGERLTVERLIEPPSIPPSQRKSHEAAKERLRRVGAC